MFVNSQTKVNTDKDATMTNLQLALTSEKNSLFGDPGYGAELQRVIYSQNNVVLKDLVIDEIYSCITTYIPQLIVKRKDIQIIADKNDLYARIPTTNAIDFSLNLYEIQLTDSQEF